MKVEVSIYSPPYSSLPVVVISRFYLFMVFSYLRFYLDFKFSWMLKECCSYSLKVLKKKQKCLIYKNTSGNWSWHHKCQIWNLFGNNLVSYDVSGCFQMSFVSRNTKMKKLILFCRISEKHGQHLLHPDVSPQSCK